MKILTLWQPWASLIAFGVKKYETRSWGTNYRGELLIHASKTQPVCVTGELERIARKIESDSLRHAIGKSLPLPQGCVLAKVNLTKCQKMTDLWFPGKLLANPNLIYADQTTEIEEECGNWTEGRFAWKLENNQSLDPIPWRGSQGLKDAPQELVDMVMAQLGVAG